MAENVSTRSDQGASNLHAALLMLVSGVGFTVHLTLAKLLSGTYDPAMLAFYRAIIGLVVTLPLILRLGFAGFQTRRFPLLFLRSLLGSAGFLMGFYAISANGGIPLAQFNAISFSRALFVIVLAALILRESVGPRRWIATAIGFVGVIVMVRPETGLDRGSLLALGAAVSMAGAIILVKTLSRDHSPLVLLTYANTLSAVMIGGYLMTPFAFEHWAPPANLYDAALIAGMAIAAVSAQSLYITAMSKGDASFLSTIDYTRLPMTASVDWLIFQEFPGPFVWVGAAIIVASTLYITWRESRPSPPRGPG